METAPPPLDGTSPSSTTSRSNGTATAATFISHRAFLNPQIPKPARDALAARAAAASPAVPASEGGAPNGVTVDHTNGTAKAASTAIRNAEGSAYQSTMGIAVDPATGGPSIHDTNAGRSNSFTRRKRSEEEAVQLQERTPYGWPDAPQAHGNGMSPAPPTWSASREALDVSHGQDVFIHPSLASAPTSAAISASNHDHGLDDPLSAGFSGRGTFGEIEQPAASVRLKSNYVIGSPKSHKQSFSEEQWMKTGGLSNGHVEDERMANNVINERKEYDTRHPFALRGNGFQNGEYPLNPVIHDVKTRRTDHDGHTGLAKDISVAVPPARRTRNYVHLNALPLQSTRYYLSGLVQTGGDSPLPLIGSVILVLGLGGLWLGSTGVWIWRDGLGGGGAGAGGKAAVIIFAYLFGIVLSSMFVTAFRDPGIIPRNLDVDPPSHRDVDGSMVPLTRDIRVRGVTVPVKYCETCKIYRPPRASHCRLCGNCVEGIDHHCTYLHTCVGRRNYTSFIAFLVSATLAVIYTVVFSALHFSIMCSREHISFKESLKRSPESAVSFAIGVLVVWPVMALMGYHLRLMFLNSTTIEQIRANAARGIDPSGGPHSNPFSYGKFWRNIARALCRPQFPSWVDPHGYSEEDLRKENPGDTGVFGIASHMNLRQSNVSNPYRSSGLSERKTNCNDRSA